MKKTFQGFWKLHFKLNSGGGLISRFWTVFGRARLGTMTEVGDMKIKISVKVGKFAGKRTVQMVDVRY